jgi:sortase A
VFWLAVGTVLIATYVAVRVDGTVGSHWALMAFQSQASTTAQNDPTQDNSLPSDFSLWSQSRITAYKKVVSAQLAAPLALLSIPRLELKVPVFDGIDDVTLNRGAGRIPGTARVGASGNLGIVADRDGFFRSSRTSRSAGRSWESHDLRPGMKLEDTVTTTTTPRTITTV